MERFGLNVLHATEKARWYIIAARQFTNVLVYILIVAALFAIAIGEMADAMTIMAIVVLNAIIGFSEMIKSEAFGKINGDKNREYVDHILDSGHHLLSVINDILDLSKVEAGKITLHKEIFKINDGSADRFIDFSSNNFL